MDDWDDEMTIEELHREVVNLREFIHTLQRTNIDIIAAMQVIANIQRAQLDREARVPPQWTIPK